MSERFDRLQRQVKEAGLETDPQIQKLIAASELVHSDRIADRLEQLVNVKTAQRKAYPWDDVAPTRYARKLDLGTAFTGSPVQLDPADLTRHILIAGRTGIGKTTLIYHLLDQFPVTWWVFDLKTDYRHLTRCSGGNLVVLPWGKMRWNPLVPPPGVTVQRWAGIFADVFADTQGLWTASKGYIVTTLMSLYQLHGVTGERTGDRAYPSLYELRDFIRETGGTGRKSAKYADTVYWRLRFVLRSTEAMLDCSRGYPLLDLLDRNVVFELDDLPNEVQNFCMEVLYTWVYAYRKANAPQDDGLDHVLVADEGKRLLARAKELQEHTDTPHAADRVSKSRGFGLGLIVADQEPGKLAKTIIANAHTRILFSVGDHQQWEDVADSMGLSRLQQRYATDSLGRGQAVVRIGDGSPVPVQFPDRDVTKDVDADELVERMRETWQGMEYVPRTPLDRVQQTADTGIETRRNKPVQQTVKQAAGTDRGDDPTALDLSPAADQFLENIARHPFLSVTDRHREVFDSRWKGNNARQELEDEQGLVDGKVFSTGDGRIKLFELTDEAKQYLREQGVTMDWPGKGGVEHRYWQQRIKQCVEDTGGTAVVEKNDVDVHAELNGKRIAFEVAMQARDREADHVTDRLDDGYDRVVVCCRDRSVRDGIRERLEDAPAPDSAVELVLVQAFTDGVPV